MRPWMIVVLMGAVSVGCNHIALEHRTVKQASTLTDLQYQQVMDNLAMFACSPDTMPWHLKLTGGLVQIADQGNAGFEANLASGISDEVKHIFSPSVGAQRGIVGQWDVDPAVEADELNQLRLGYAKAVKTCRQDHPTLADVEMQIEDAIVELALRFDVLPSEEMLKRVLRRKEVNLVQEAAKELADLKNKVGTCKKLADQAQAAEDALNKEVVIHDKLEAAARVLRSDIVKALRDYCDASQAARDAHYTLGDANGQSDQRRKYSMLRDIYSALAGVREIDFPKNDEFKKLLGGTKTEKEGADKDLDDALKKLQQQQDAFADLKYASEKLDQAAKIVSDVVAKPNGYLTKKAIEFCSDPVDIDKYKAIDGYCAAMKKLDEFHARADSIDRVTGPMATTTPGVKKTYSRGAGQELLKDARAAVTVVVAQPIERDEQVRRVLKVLEVEFGTSFTSREDAKSPTRRNPGLIDQAEDKMKALQDLLTKAEFSTPWFQVGCKKDVPRCACYVGYFHGCCGDCYVWVMPEQIGTLRKFTQVVLALAAIEKQDIASTVPGRGAAFSPSIR